MISKSEYGDVIQDYVVILKKQTQEFTGEELVDFLELLNTSRDSNIPVVYLGDSGKLMFRYIDGHIEEIAAKKIRDIMGYERFKRTGIIEPKEDSEK